MKAAGKAEGKSASTQLLLLTGISLGTVSIFSFLSVLFVWLVFDENIAGQANALSDFQNPITIPILKFMQVFQSTGLFIVPPIILAYLVSSRPLKWLKLQPAYRTGYQLFLTLLLMLFCQPFINCFAAWNAELPLSEWMQEAEKRAAEVTRAFLSDTHFSGLLINLLIVGILPGLGEELFFRGAIQNLFIRASRNTHVGIWIAAIIFSAIHMQFLGFFPRLFLGALFGYLASWSGSLWIPVFAHSLNNISAVLIHWLVLRGDISVRAEDIGAQQQDLIYVLVCTFICLWFMKMIHDLNWKRGFSLSKLIE